MNEEQIKKRIDYLKIEIAHGRFWDGYALNGMKTELKELEEKLNGK